MNLVIRAFAKLGKANMAMLMGITAVGADTYTYGSKTVGSILVNRMKVAGS